MDHHRRGDGGGRRQATLRPGEDPLAFRRLPPGFFDRSTVRIARALLGGALVRGAGPARAVARIVETEAYLVGDAASHAFRGPTPRNRAMFGSVGRWYVFRIHQVHCANVVTGPGEAVLLRAATALSPGLGNLSGPGRLARAFGFDLTDGGRSVRSGRVRILGGPSPRERILVGPRVGIRRDAERPLRFYLEGVAEVSRPR